MQHYFIRLAVIAALSLAAVSAHANETVSVYHAAEGTVQGIDNAAGKVTLKHGPIKSKTVEMPAMTMSFPVAKPAQLAEVKKGDRVAFVAEKVNGTITVTDLKVAK